MSPRTATKELFGWGDEERASTSSRLRRRGAANSHEYPGGGFDSQQLLMVGTTLSAFRSDVGQALLGCQASSGVRRRRAISARMSASANSISRAISRFVKRRTVNPWAAK